MNSGKEKGNCILLDGYEYIDCISILSIKRKTVDYVYTTLQNLFLAIPSGIPINIYVGNENTEYLSSSVLENFITKENIQRINVIQFSSAYLEKLTKMHVHKRAKCNYARILCDYDGYKGLIIFEDDIDVNNNILNNVNTIVKYIREPTFVMSLYDKYGKEKTNHYNITKVKHGFSCTQGMYYTHSIANELGKYMLETNGCYDIVINMFCKQINNPIRYVMPSLTQHIGTLTTGLGGVHVSKNFQKESTIETFSIDGKIQNIQ